MGGTLHRGQTVIPEMAGLFGGEETKKIPESLIGDCTFCVAVEERGELYDKVLWNKAKAYEEEKISYPEAVELYNKFNKPESNEDLAKKTIDYALDVYQWTPKAKLFMNEALKGKFRDGAYYKEVSGVQYDRLLLEKCEDYTAVDGTISKEAAETLWTSALDGESVTPEDWRTLSYSMRAYKYKPEAKEFMIDKLGLNR